MRPEEILDPSFAAECREALERFGVLVFPQIGLSDEQQVVFSSRLGEVAPQGMPKADGSRDLVFKVTLDPKKNEAAEYLKGKEIALSVDLGSGPASSVVWTCDLSAEYVRINAEYRT